MKVKIKIVYLGYIPHSIDKVKIENWKSDLFEIVLPIGNHTITKDSDGPSWSFSDRNIQSILPQKQDGENVLIAITSVPLEDNFYTRIFSESRICVSYHEMTQILKSENIPLENLILRVAYNAALVYKRYNGEIPSIQELIGIHHDETRGCLFDMTGIKSDIIYSTHKPIICEECVVNLSNSRVEKNLLNTVQKELKKIKKGLYYQLTDLIKNYPMWAIVISSLSALIIGIVSSILATKILDFFSPHIKI